MLTNIASLLILFIPSGYFLYDTIQTYIEYYRKGRINTFAQKERTIFGLHYTKKILATLATNGFSFAYAFDLKPVTFILAAATLSYGIGEALHFRYFLKEVDLVMKKKFDPNEKGDDA